MPIECPTPPSSSCVSGTFSLLPSALLKYSVSRITPSFPCITGAVVAGSVGRVGCGVVGFGCGFVGFACGFVGFTCGFVIDVIIGGDDVKNEKPDPEGLLTAIQKLNVSKNQALYVGDSIVDAKTAQSAGVDFVAVLTGTTEREEFMNYEYVSIEESVRELTSYLHKRDITARKM